MAGQATRGKLWCCEVWRGLSGLGGARLAGRGEVRKGTALLGMARRGQAVKVWSVPVG